MTTQRYAWEGPLATQAVASRLLEMLFGPGTKRVEPEALQAEIIRVALWEQSVLRQPDMFSNAAALTQQLLSRARLLWAPFGDMAVPIEADSSQPIAKSTWSDEECWHRQTLDMLAEQGDLLALPQGHWLPAPLRLVPAAAQHYLVVGGIPSSLLPTAIIRALRLHGSFRQIETHIIQANPFVDQENRRWRFQALEHWLGPPAADFQELLHHFQHIELFPVAAPNDSQSIEVYNASFDKPQWLRWRPPARIAGNGRYLLREQVRWGILSYSVGEIQNRQIKQQSHLLASLDIRRLCYALDADARKPTRVTWKKERGQGVLILSTELPARERKWLATLGQLQPRVSQKYYPRIWHISVQNEEIVKGFLSQLGIIIQ
jgi:hypothetical protein